MAQRVGLLLCCLAAALLGGACAIIYLKPEGRDAAIAARLREGGLSEAGIHVALEALKVVVPLVAFLLSLAVVRMFACGLGACRARKAAASPSVDTEPVTPYTPMAGEEMLFLTPQSSHTVRAGETSLFLSPLRHTPGSTVAADR